MEDITGIWIGDNDSGLYQELFLSGKGSGWFEYGRADYTVIQEFTWCHSAPEQISFEYGEIREVDRYEVTVDRGGEPSSHTYELIDGEILRFASPFHGTRDYCRGQRNRPFVQ